MQVTPPENDVLWARELVMSHQGTLALRGVSLGVRQGEVLAVTGPRGSGKSTLLQCLGAVLAVEEGEVWFEGIPVHSLAPSARERLRRECFGFIGPRPCLVPELTALENTALPLMLAGARRRQAQTAAAEWLERLDVADCARKRPAALRQEQRQRVSVARALAHHPSVVLADEPAAPLHRAAADQVLRILATAARSHSISLVLATTDPEAARYADRVSALIDGRLAAPLPGRTAAVPAGGRSGPEAPAAARPQQAGRRAAPEPPAPVLDEAAGATAIGAGAVGDRRSGRDE